jgi:hypothetical protein
MEFGRSSGKWNAFSRFEGNSNHSEGQEQSLLSKGAPLSAPDGSGSGRCVAHPDVSSLPPYSPYS